MVYLIRVRGLMTWLCAFERVGDSVTASMYVDVGGTVNPPALLELTVDEATVKIANMQSLGFAMSDELEAQRVICGVA